METLAQDLKLALRSLRRAPTYTVAAVVALALAIGANTALFSLIEATLLRPYPYPHPEQLVLAEAVRFRSPDHRPEHHAHRQQLYGDRRPAPGVPLPGGARGVRADRAVGRSVQGSQRSSRHQRGGAPASAHDAGEGARRAERGGGAAGEGVPALEHWPARQRQDHPARPDRGFPSRAPHALG